MQSCHLLFICSVLSGPDIECSMLSYTDFDYFSARIQSLPCFWSILTRVKKYSSCLILS